MFSPAKALLISNMSYKLQGVFNQSRENEKPSLNCFQVYLFANAKAGASKTNPSMIPHLLWRIRGSQEQIGKCTRVASRREQSIFTHRTLWKLSVFQIIIFLHMQSNQWWTRNSKCKLHLCGEGREYLI